MADTKIIFGYNCVAPLKLHSTFYENFEKSKIATLKVTLIVVGDLPMMLQELILVRILRYIFMPY